MFIVRERNNLIRGRLSTGMRNKFHIRFLAALLHLRCRQNKTPVYSRFCFVLLNTGRSSLFPSHTLWRAWMVGRVCLEGSLAIMQISRSLLSVCFWTLLSRRKRCEQWLLLQLQYITNLLQVYLTEKQPSFRCTGESYQCVRKKVIFLSENILATFTEFLCSVKIYSSPHGNGDRITRVTASTSFRTLLQTPKPRILRWTVLFKARELIHSESSGRFGGSTSQGFHDVSRAEC